ncbi:MAG: YbfB/YjiJ family MFS transporter [Acetobacteraceae bacterium]|nr:YbfB/YjiJ family MFS transporter [Acetobacteraceae bacterium]
MLPPTWREEVRRVGEVQSRRERATGLAPAVGGMLALAAALGIGRFVYTPILPAMAEALGLTKTEAGLIASANFAGYLAGALLAALPRLPGGSRRAWFLAALAASALTTAAMGWADATASFLLLRFVGGAASAFVLVLGSALVLDRLARAGLDRWGALHFAGVGLGIAASAILVDALQAAGAGWRTLWLGSGAAAAVALPLAAALVRPEASVGAQPTPSAAPRSAASLPAGLGALTLCHGLFGFGYVVTATFIVAAVRSAPALRTLEGEVWLVVGLAAVPSTAAWTWAAQLLGVLPAYALACLLAAIGVAAGGVWETASGALLAAVLLGGTFMGITALGFAAARAAALDDGRRASALMTAGFGLGQVVGPLVAGRLLDATGSFAPPSLLAAAALAGAAWIAILAARRGDATAWAGRR